MEREDNSIRTPGVGVETAQPAFILSEALPIIPAKLVRRILKGEFIDMAELLKDNMEVQRKHYLTEGEQVSRGFTP